MKRVVLLLSVMLMGLGMQVRAASYEQNRVIVDGMVFYYNIFNWSQLFSGKDAEGNVVVPDSIYDEKGIVHPVCEINRQAFKDNDKIIGIKLPTTLVGIHDYAFQNCKNLRTVVIPSHTFCLDDGIFEGCNLDTLVTATPTTDIAFSVTTSIKNLYIQSGDTATIGGGCTIGNCYLSDIDHLVIDCNPFGTYLALLPDGKSYYSVKAVSVEAVEPPTVEKQRYSRPEDMKLCWTVLFVPDGSEEKYRQAEFWKDFYCIKPLSEMNRYDEFVAEANAAFSEWAKEYLASMDNITKDINECTIEGNQLQFTSAANAKVCDLAGRVIHSGKHAQGESLTLPQGVSIVTVNGHCFKVAVK